MGTLSWQFTPFAAAYIGTIALNLALAALTWSRRTARGAPTLALLCLLNAIWGLAYTLSFFNTNLDWKLALVPLEYLGIAGVPLLWALFVAQFTQYAEKQRPWLVPLVALPGLITLGLTLTLDHHNLMYHAFAITTTPNGMIVTVKEYGTWFWIYAMWQYALTFATTALMLSVIIRHPEKFRGQGYLMGVAALLPIIANFIYIFDLIPGLIYDLSSLSFGISAFLLAIALLRFQLFDVMPVAHDIVLHSINAGVIVLDHLDRVVQVNAFVQELFPGAEKGIGYPLLKVPGLNILPVIGVGRNPGQNTHYLQLEKRLYQVRTSPLLDAGNDEIGQLLMLWDITQQKETEQHLAHARDAAEEANRLKSAFLATISHELRTPLSAVIGYTDLILEGVYGEMNPNLAERIKAIRENGVHLLALINDVLDLSKIEAQRMSLELLPFNCDSLIQGTIMTTLPLIEHNRNEIKLMDHGPIGEITNDPTRLKQVLINLISNAAKFTEGGLITLDARLEPGDDAEWLVIDVADTGIGMTESQQQTVFNRFSQGDNSITRKYGGTGLGLPISRALCDLMGGTLTVDSEENIGTVFTLRVPRHVQPQEVERPMV